MPTTIESFSMRARHTTSAGVSYRIEHGEGPLPTIDVRPPPLYPRLSKCLQQTTEGTRNRAYRAAEQWFWDEADALAERTWRGAYVQQVGRSGGWLVVLNVGDPRDWRTADVRRWRSFEKRIRSLMDKAEKLWHKLIREEEPYG